MKPRPGATTTAKASAVELAVLLVLCPLAGVGAGLAFASALVGLAIGGVCLIAVAAYALASNIDTLPPLHLPSVRWPSVRLPAARREAPRGLSVTDISARSRAARAHEDRPRDESGLAPTVAPEDAPAVVPIVMNAAEPDRVVPFRLPSVRL